MSATFPPPLVTAAEILFCHVEKKAAKRGEMVTRPLPKRVMLCTSAIKKGLDCLALVSLGGDEAGGGGHDVDESAVLRGVLHFRRVVQGYHAKQKLPALLDVLTTTAYQQAFVFCNDSNRAAQIAELLGRSGVAAAATSGRMDQTHRTQAFVGLKQSTYRVLVCTDLMARGVDVENVDLIVNLDLPEEKETYLHRSGRTARFGSIGCAVNIVFEGDEDEHLKYFQMQLCFELQDYADREAAIAARLDGLGVGAQAAEGAALLSAVPAAAAPSAAAVLIPAPRLGHDSAGRNRGTRGHERWGRTRADGRRGRGGNMRAQPLPPPRPGRDEQVDEYEEEEEEEVDEDGVCDEELEEEEEECEYDAEGEECDGEDEEGWQAHHAPEPATVTQPRCPAPEMHASRCMPATGGVPASTGLPWAIAPEVLQNGWGGQNPDETIAAVRAAAVQAAAALKETAAQQAAAVQQAFAIQQAVAAQQALAAQQAAAAQLAAAAWPPATHASARIALPSSFTHLLPPPIFVGSGASVPAEVFSAAPPPEWEAWMLHCGTYGEYAMRCPGSAVPVASAARQRLEEMWANHCRIWTQ